MTPLREVLSWLDRRDRRDGLVVLLLGAGLAAAVLGPARAVTMGLLASLCLFVTRLDGRRFLIPDLLSLATAGLGLADAVLTPVPLTPRLLAMLLLGGVLWLVRAGVGAWKGRTALGLGDVKYVMAAAAWLPAEILPGYLFLAAVSGLVEALVRGDRDAKLAFGRHLAPWLWICGLAAPWLQPLIGRM